MSLWSAILGGLLLGLFMAISVGPTLFAIIKYSLNHSYKTGIAFILGVSISDIIYVAIANIAAPWLSFIYRYEKIVALSFGVVLIALGLVGLLRKYKAQRPSSSKNIITNGHYFKIFASGFLINTANPAVMLNWIVSATAVSKATIDFSTSENIIYRSVFFGVCLALVLGIDILKVILADSIRRKLTLRKVMYLQKTSSLILLIIGITLLLLAIFGPLNKSHKAKQASVSAQGCTPLQL